MIKLKRMFCVLTSCATSILLINTPLFSANATTIAGIVDNDTSNPYYSNYSNTIHSFNGTWGTYLSNGYNNDSRLRQSITKGNYEWVWNANIYTTSSINWIAKVYLANASFTDPNAYYEIYEDTYITMPCHYFHLNQNLAPNGFSVFSGTMSPSPNYNGTLNPWFGLVQNSGISGVGTGADAFYFQFTY